mmetsp:Transcript_55547/g.132408  ORF Transcript_55547/g.132408 Transcript_55547/m.132408 type:complete len:203 (+) Transcript_55547:58-666(+)
MQDQPAVRTSTMPPTGWRAPAPHQPPATTMHRRRFHPPCGSQRWSTQDQRARRRAAACSGFSPRGCEAWRGRDDRLPGRSAIATVAKNHPARVQPQVLQSSPDTSATASPASAPCQRPCGQDLLQSHHHSAASLRSSPSHPASTAPLPSLQQNSATFAPHLQIRTVSCTDSPSAPVYSAGDVPLWRGSPHRWSQRSHPPPRG